AETSQPASDDAPQSLPRPPAKPELVAQSEAVAGPETSAESQTTSASIENQTRLTLAPPPRPRAPSRDRVIERQPRPAPAPATQATPSTIQTDGRFGLQFVAFAEFSRARAYILQNELKGDTLIYRLPEGSGGALFAVIKGSYPDRDSANAAIVGLSRTLRATGPWPRELTGLRPIRP
ncbi:MAG: SPOR domain-containing protein, partial [Gammaproteobacteria bacterium]